MSAYTKTALYMDINLLDNIRVACGLFINLVCYLFVVLGKSLSNFSF